MEREMEIGRLIKAMLRSWWIFVILAAIGGATGYYLSVYNHVSTYRADSTLYIMNRDKTQVTGQTLNYNDLSFSRQLVKDYSQIINSRMVTSEVARRLKNSFINENTVRAMIAVGIEEGSNILTISAISNDPQLAAQVANTTSKVFVDKMNELTNSNNVGVLDQAGVPMGPMSTSSSKKMPLGVVAGIAIAAAFVFVRESFDTTIRSVEEIEDGLKLEVIGIIPEHAIK